MVLFTLELPGGFWATKAKKQATLPKWCFDSTWPKLIKHHQKPIAILKVSIERVTQKPFFLSLPKPLPWRKQNRRAAALAGKVGPGQIGVPLRLGFRVSGKPSSGGGSVGFKAGSGGCSVFFVLIRCVSHSLGNTVFMIWWFNGWQAWKDLFELRMMQTKSFDTSKERNRMNR